MAFPSLMMLAALLGLALSPFTVVARGTLWLGPQTLVLTLGGLIAGGAIALAARRFAQSTRGSFLDPPRVSPLAAPLIIVAAPLLSAVILRLCFQAFANSADEYVFLFQSWTLLAGRLVNPLPPDTTLFGLIYVIAEDGKWVGQYLPGWPAMLALVQAAGIPAWCAAAISGALLLALLAGALKRVCASPPLRLALLFAYGCSGFFLLNGATYFSHCFSTAAEMGVIYCLLRAETGRLAWWSAAGAFAGLAGLCRVDSGLLAAVAAVGAWAGQRFQAPALAAGLLGLAPPLALLLGYDAAVTGDPFVIPTEWGGNLRIGAGGISGVETWTGGPRVPVQTLWRIGELADTGSLLLPALYLYCLARRVKERAARFYDVVPLANLVLFMIFPDLGGFQMGPRYWFSGFAVMHLTVGSEFARTGPPARRFAVACCVLLGMLGLARLPGQVIFFSRVLHERATVYRLGADLPKDRRAMILVPDFPSAWDERFDRTGLNRAWDFARNGIAVDGPVLYGRGDSDDAPQRACRLYPDTSLYRFRLDRERPEGELLPLGCPVSRPDSAAR